MKQRTLFISHTVKQENMELHINIFCTETQHDRDSKLCLLFCQVAVRLHLCLPSQVLVLLTPWLGPALREPLSPAPVTTGAGVLEGQTGTGEAAAIMWNLAGYLGESL